VLETGHRLWCRLACVISCTHISTMTNDSRSPQTDLERGPNSELSLGSSLLNLLEVLMALQDEQEVSPVPAQNGPINFTKVRGTNVSTNIQSGNGAPSRPPPRDSPEELKDFADSANALWSLYRKEIQAHDEV